MADLQPAVPPEPLPPMPSAASKAAPRPKLDPLVTARLLADMAQRLETSLPPVEPREAFIGELNRRLEADRPRALAEAREEAKRRLRLWWMAGLGGTLSVLGLGYVGYHALKALGGRGRKVS